MYSFLEDRFAERLKDHLKANDMAMKQGAIIDATLLSSPLLPLGEGEACNVRGLTPAAELLHGQGTEVYADSGYQGIKK